VSGTRQRRAAGCVRRTLNVFPDLLALHEANPGRYPHLLESAADGPPQARYDILFAFPGETLALDPDRQLRRDGVELADGDFLAAFERDWRALTLPPQRAHLPFTGGWFVFLGYELAEHIEPVLRGLPREHLLPRAVATRFPAAVIRDRARRRTHAVCEPQQAAELLPLMLADLERAAAPSAAPAAPRVEIAEEDGQRFLGGVARVLEYIRAGDVFQVNLSRAWQATLDPEVTNAALYRRLRTANPAPFAALMQLDPQRAVISSSPERLVCVRGRRISTRPIAGTWPRAADPGQDREAIAALRGHPKEQAEHVMLLDLERNDLGRLCRPGSVRVSEFMTVESYRHVHHLVSEVGGELRPAIGPVEIIRAVFPGGTITGCPKLRCMQIIAELEGAGRGAYTGSLGYINRDGSMDLNILIRTMVRAGRSVHLRAGAGIVADSLPERELAETRAKAHGLLAALAAP
jgi:anthranilate synthase component 1